MYKPTYFKPFELVPPTIYDMYQDEDEIYELFDENLLRIIDMIREWAGVPLTVNNWKSGGLRKESGLRETDTSTGAAKSAHKAGKAVDMVSSTKSAQELWQIIDANAYKLPCKIRIEKTSGGKPITWLHVDTAAKPDQIPKVYYFNA